MSSVRSRDPESELGEAGKSVIIFDGVCNFCSAAVRFVLKRDRMDRFRFASFQSAVATRLFRAGSDRRAIGQVPERVDPSSIVLIEDSVTYTKSTAALRIARQLDGIYPLLYGLILIPRFIRDWAYDFFASHRYGWFGKMDECVTPTEEQRRKFLS